MKDLKTSILEALKGSTLKPKIYKWHYRTDHNAYDTTLIINKNIVNVKGKPKEEGWSMVVTTSDFYIPANFFANLMASIKNEPDKPLEVSVKPASGNDPQFKKIWIRYEPTRWDTYGRMYFFQNTKGKSKQDNFDYETPYQDWQIDDSNLREIMADNPEL